MGAKSCIRSKYAAVKTPGCRGKTQFEDATTHGGAAVRMRARHNKAFGRGDYDPGKAKASDRANRAKGLKTGAVHGETKFQDNRDLEHGGNRERAPKQGNPCCPSAEGASESLGQGSTKPRGKE